MTGLLRLVGELERRGLVAILVLNNFWPWSGGMAQYLAWTGKGPIPRGYWYDFHMYTGGFFTSDAATSAFVDYLRFLVPQLKNSRAVIWELCNEARPVSNVTAPYRNWIDVTAGRIKSMAPDQLVTTGCEGDSQSNALSNVNIVRDHESIHIDFITFHMWPWNWEWFGRDGLSGGFARALDRSKKYVTKHAILAARMNKPIVLEAFSFPRDGASCVPGSATTLRDRYFDEIYGVCGDLMRTTSIAGILPWGFSGRRKPPRPGDMWKPGDAFTGDPPHIPQGGGSIYSDDPTLKVVKDWSARLAHVSPLIQG